jgi:hypothetical protein
MPTTTLENHSVIKSRRTLLVRVLDIARAMERMHDGLQAVIFLGEPETKLPPEIRTFFSEIGDRLKEQDKTTLLKYIAKLDGLIEQDIKQVLSIAQLQQVDASPKAFPQASLELLNNFRRRAQTSISLRMLLRKRGIRAPDVTFDFSLPIIKDRLSELEQNERSQRQKAVKQIREMQKDLSVLLEKPDQGDEMKEVLQGVIQGLENDIKAIMSGEKLENLPMSFEEIDDDSAWQTPFYEEESVASEEEENEIETQAESSQQEADVKITTLGFFARLKRWLLTPWAMSWKQIEKQSKKKTGEG